MGSKVEGLVAVSIRICFRGEHLMRGTKRIRSVADELRAAKLYQRGDEAWSKGDLPSAFRYFLAAAKMGMTSAFRTVGHFYDSGEGVKADPDEALYWYKMAARNGEWDAANNIGCILRDRGKQTGAIAWFKRAVKLGDGNANLNIAKIYLKSNRDMRKAIAFLTRASKSPWATEDAKEEARLLLKRFRIKKVGGAG